MGKEYILVITKFDIVNRFLFFKQKKFCIVIPEVILAESDDGAAMQIANQIVGRLNSSSLSEIYEPQYLKELDRLKRNESNVDTESISYRKVTKKC